MLAHFFFKYTYTLHEVWILLAQAYVLLFQQPPRQSAHLPFGTDVWSGAHNDVHAVALCRAAELGYVVVASEVEHTLLLLVYVPEYVYTHRIHTQGFAHLYPMFPIGARDAWIVNLCRLDGEWFAVKQERAVPSLECSFLCQGKADGQCQGKGHD